MSGFSNTQEYQRPIGIRDEGLTIARNVGYVDFTGAGVTATPVGGTTGADVGIPGGGGGTGTPGGSTTQLQYNNASAFGGITNVLTDGTNLGLATAAPTHSLTLASTATGIALYNTTDQTTNYERGRMYWTGNQFTLSTELGGTGGARGITVSSAASIALTAASTGSFTASGSTLTLTNGAQSLQFKDSSGGDKATFTTQTSGVGAAGLKLNHTSTSSSGIGYGVSQTFTVNQTSTSGYTAYILNVIETATGNGAKLLADLQVGGTSKFKVDNTGAVTTASLTNGLVKSASGLLSNATTGTDYLAPAAIGVTVQGYDANTTILGNTTTGTGNVVLAASPSLSGTQLTGTTTAGTIRGGANAGSNINITASGNAAATTAQMTIGAATNTSTAPNLVFTTTGATFGAAGAPGLFALAGTTSGSTTLQSLAVASGTLILPSATDTLIGKATTDILTNKNLSSTTNTFPVASTSVAGVVKVDGTTITITGGVISAIRNPVTVTTTYSITTVNAVILADATSGAFSITLPDATTLTAGTFFDIKKIDTTLNEVTITPSGSQTIDGAVYQALSSPNQTVRVLTNATNWFLF